MTEGKHPISFRLSEEALGLVRGLSKRYGISQAGVIEMALRFFAERMRPHRRTDTRKGG
jgi:hypothetical protein